MCTVRMEQFHSICNFKYRKLYYSLQQYVAIQYNEVQDSTVKQSKAQYSTWCDLLLSKLAPVDPVDRSP